jgi:hypothetical protein
MRKVAPTHAACEDSNEKLRGGVGHVEENEHQEALAGPVSGPENARHQPPEAVICKTGIL